MQTISFALTGTAPLIVHSARLADPLNEWAKAIAEITKKRKKTDSDHLEIAHREFLGSLYLSDRGEPIIPGGNLERMLRDAAKMSKQGKQVQSGLIVTEDSVIEYDGPRDPEKLWASGKHRLRASAKVGQQRVIRTRPAFMPWKLSFTVTFDDSILSKQTITDFVDVAGRFIGLSDWRPKYGRFTFEVLR